ncbi:unnamed protein product, partial [Choristocarpus tenellus]
MSGAAFVCLHLDRRSLSSLSPWRVKGNAGVRGMPSRHPVLHVGRQFEASGCSEEVWEAAMEEVLHALEISGHVGIRKNNSKVQPVGEESRWGYTDIVCKGHHGRPKSTTPHQDPSKRRIKRSQKTDCPFKVSLKWPAKDLWPSISQIRLFHNHELPSRDSTKALVSPKELDSRAEDIFQWVERGVPVEHMVAVLKEDFGEQELGEHGKRKVRMMAAKYQQALSVSVSAINQKKDKDKESHILQKVGNSFDDQQISEPIEDVEEANAKKFLGGARKEELIAN